ncbi:MAG: hypothetical protein GKS04_01865 [Candidatus Mycalebacterium zealandia]|nr:MAG: hypothetical protein GKS04_01865 [Candidatus Mycalebacterium zealandia]
MLAITRHEPYAVCIPLGEANKANEWKLFTIKGGENCEPSGATKPIIENAIPYKVFQKGGKTEIRKIVFRPRGTSSNKSFCIESKNRNRWKTITISSFARITVTSNSENPCN